jgi:hypothetical protein
MICHKSLLNVEHFADSKFLLKQDHTFTSGVYLDLKKSCPFNAYQRSQLAVNRLIQPSVAKLKSLKGAVIIFIFPW